MSKFRILALAGCMATAVVVGSAALAAGGNDGNGASQGKGFAGGMHRGGFGQGEFNHGGFHRSGFHHGAMGLRALGRVGLSDSQKATIVNLLKSNRTKMQAIRTEERDARKAMAGIKPDDANYNTALESSAAKIADATKQRVELRGQLRASIYNVLTPDQKTKLAALKTQNQYDRIFGRDNQGKGNWQRGNAGSPT